MNHLFIELDDLLDSCLAIVGILNFLTVFFSDSINSLRNLQLLEQLLNFSLSWVIGIDQVDELSLCSFSQCDSKSGFDKRNYLRYCSLGTSKLDYA